MINPKNICISACIGFFLSFLIGLISSVHFSTVLLRALIFAVIFAVLSVGISFLYQKFLVADTGSFSSDTDSSAVKPQAGSVVNIVVDDSPLPDEELAPKFTVLNPHSDFEQSKSSPSQPQASSAPVAQPSPEVSVSGAESVPDSIEPVQAQPAASVGPASNPGPEPASQGAAFKPVNLGESTPENASLDELPDISDMQTVESADVASDLDSSGSEVVSDTEFATGGAKMKEQPVSGDTATMAKAIQTLLAKDN